MTVPSLWTWRTALLELAASLAALVGLIASLPFLAAAGFAGMVLVTGWTVRREAPSRACTRDTAGLERETPGSSYPDVRCMMVR